MDDERAVFPTSRCHGCVHVRRVVSGRGSVFLMCEEPSLPKYTSQPVTQCDQFTAKAD